MAITLFHPTHGTIGGGVAWWYSTTLFSVLRAKSHTLKIRLQL